MTQKEIKKYIKDRSKSLAANCVKKASDPVIITKPRLQRFLSVLVEGSVTGAFKKFKILKGD